ncbi:MAG TPA: helicase-related protein [Rhizomicrobium sp.]|nr:helicase-related protein [Rhizomicrobium sp.]
MAPAHHQSGRPAEVGRITAVLGPTNTGKTHFAIERMLAHRSGMIGLPLRLLAREVYDKITRLKGAAATALITGEEKIVPPNARYYVCTVEAMPLDTRVACLVVDEIQLCADPERGHVFTDRLLFARGEEETMFLGADTMRGLIQRFVPRAWFISRARFSDLAYTGAKKLTRLPRRSAVVAFSTEDVYGIAELIRRQRGGAAVVLGALSPRTRNAQVALYQSGEVDFLVATDAIGMGLNMDVDHVAFAARDKFDGRVTRPLTPAEIGQIAGRAGRHMNDGTFGVTAESEPFDAEVVARVEAHRYDPVRVLQWRNGALDFSSLDGLVKSLDAPAPERGLAKARPATDFLSLRALSAHAHIRDRVTSRAALHRLWDVCQLPDFRKLSIDDHIRMVETIYGHLMSESGVLPEDWLDRQIERLNIIEGDVATLSGRLAQIRTWTYAAHRPGWTEHARHWQERSRAVEDRLSDALHERLTQRFIDRRTSVLMKKLRDDDLDDLKLDESGAVIIGEDTVGKLEGFRFEPDTRAEGIHGRTLRAAALRGLEGEFHSRATRLASAPDGDITLSEHGRLWWDGAIIARLTTGKTPLDPIVSLLADEHLRGEQRSLVQARLDSWLKDKIAKSLAPLTALRDGTDAKAGSPNAIPANARGLAWQLCENLGTLPRQRDEMGDLRPLIRGLRPFGVWLGRRNVYMPALLKPDAARLLYLLRGIALRVEQFPPAPLPGITSFTMDEGMQRELLHAAGFRAFGGRAIRLDMLERIEEELEKAVTAGTPAEEMLTKLVSLLGCDRESMDRVLDALGWQKRTVEGKAPIPAESVPVDGATADAVAADTGAADTGAAEGAVGETPAEAAAVTTITVLRRKSLAPRKNHDRRPPRPAAPRADSPFAELAVLVRK